MNTQIFAIVLPKTNQEVIKRIKDNYPDRYYEVSDTFFLISTDSLTNSIAEAIGIKGEKRIEKASGIVFKLNGAYSGWASRSLWEWLEKIENATR